MSSFHVHRIRCSVVSLPAVWPPAARGLSAAFWRKHERHSTKIQSFVLLAMENPELCCSASRHPSCKPTGPREVVAWSHMAGKEVKSHLQVLRREMAREVLCQRGRAAVCSPKLRLREAALFAVEALVTLETCF